MNPTAIVAAFTNHQWLLLSGLSLAAVVALAKQGWLSDLIAKKLTPTVIPYYTLLLSVLSVGSADSRRRQDLAAGSVGRRRRRVHRGSGAPVRGRVRPPRAGDCPAYQDHRRAARVGAAAPTHPDAVQRQQESLNMISPYRTLGVVAPRPARRIDRTGLIVFTLLIGAALVGPPGCGVTTTQVKAAFTDAEVACEALVLASSVIPSGTPVSQVAADVSTACNISTALLPDVETIVTSFMGSTTRAPANGTVYVPSPMVGAAKARVVKP